MRNQQAAVCRTTVVAAVTLKKCKFACAYLHQDTTDWTLVLLGYLGGLERYGTEMSP